MRKLVVGLVLATLLTLAAVVPASAHTAIPCNDTDGDGSPSGQEYAKHHIAAKAQLGELGAGGHIPGAHQGFSVCDPSG